MAYMPAGDQGLPYAMPYGGAQQQVAYGAAPAYGAMYDVPGPVASGGKPLFVQARRRRMNIQPLFLCILAPWGLFSAVYAALSFSIHYEEPMLCWGIVSAGLLAVVVAGALACSASGRWFANAEHEPTWLVFLFLSLLVAFLSGYAMGTSNYNLNMRTYFDMKNLNSYSDVYPERMHGQQVMDAGVVEFTSGSRIDLTRSMGFKNNIIYCVAPITHGDTAPATYDFWVVGKDCCSGNQANFHCANFNNPHANGGLRLMSDNDRAFYRLAVQQAEATYNIKAVHPLFFEWTVDPIATVESWRHAGRSDFLVWMMSYFVFQIFLVAVAALAFSKLGFA